LVLFFKKEHLSSYVSAGVMDRHVLTCACYRLTEEDSVAALKLDGQPSRALLVVYAIAGFGLFALCLVGSITVKPVAGLALLGGIVGEALGRHVIAPAGRRRGFRRNTLLHNEFTIKVSDGDIRIFSIATDVVLTSGRVVKWSEGKDHILIYVGRRVYFTIPKRVAAAGFDLEILRAKLRDYTRRQSR
jgi:hypothetical protein